MDENPLSSCGWSVITSVLPQSWAQRASELGLCRSMARTDGVERAKLRDPALLLRLVLHHVQTGDSLDQTVALAKSAGLVNVSGVALHLRMRKVSPWLSELAAAMTGTTDLFDAARWAGFRIFCTDATTGTRPGAKGTTFRVHYRIHAQTLLPQQVQYTDDSGGETLRRFTIAPGDLDLLDRAYCTPPGVEHSVGHGGDVVVRFNRGTLPLLDPRLRPMDLEAKVLRMRTRDRARSWPVVVSCATSTVIGRVVALRLPRPQARQSLRRLLKEKGPPSVPMKVRQSTARRLLSRATEV